MVRFELIFLAVLTVLAPARAEMVVDVVKTGQGGKVAIDLSAVQHSGSGGAEFAKTLTDDLVRSGWFVVRLGAPVLVQASLSSGGFGGGLRTTCVAQNRAGGTFLKKSIREKSGNVRRLAHAAADAIVEAVARKKGIASTKILMVGARGGRKDLYLCDADGHNMVNVTQRGFVCTSPAWTPDAKSLIFTWFVKGNPDVYTVELANRAVRRVAGFPGLNAGADVSPDGKRVVLTLSKDGNPELYVMGIGGGGRPARITRTPHAAEASPSWSPRGDQIVFVADQAGAPQLYLISASGGAVKRIGVRGSENVNPDWGPDGRIVFSSRRAGRYQICVFNPVTGATQAVSSDDADYEDPSWAPDGRHIVCTRTVHFDSDLYILDTLGDAPLRLTALQGDWHSPAWSPQ